ncbi:MAG: glycosyltransferase family 2 protein [Anaerobacillus sp.]|uniref:glycosyltransferase family 2 protein n=1 Tax=Anaerobacillus sp. TaxID=1872506 RepID=UPI00391DF40C
MENTQNPLVSIIIPCYNYGLYLEEAVNSALNQTYQNIEVIVVNDASTDLFTLEKLEQLSQLSIKIIHHKENKGISATRNTAVKASAAKYILPLDADDVIDPETVEKTVKILENNAEIGFVSMGTRFFGDVNDIYIPPKYNFYTLLYRNIVSPTSLFRKKAWEQVGGYNENYIYGYEDWEFWINLAKNGWHGFSIEEPLFHYRKHGKSMIDTAVKNHHQIINQLMNTHGDLYNPITNKNIKNNWIKTVAQKQNSKSFIFRTMASKKSGFM